MKKAQSGDVVMMLIGGVFAVALLIVIYGVIGAIEPPISGFEVIMDVSKQAYKAQGLCFSRQAVPFHDSEVVMLKDILIPDLTFKAKGNLNAFSRIGTSLIAEVATSMPVSVKCNSETDCTLYFGDANCGSTTIIPPAGPPSLP